MQKTWFNKLWNKNYKWLYLTWYHFKVASSNPLFYVVNIFATVIYTLSIAYIWQFNNSGIEVITYLVVGRLYRTTIDSYPYFNLGSEINSGKITNKLLYPSEFFDLNLFVNLGRRISANFIATFGGLLSCVIAWFTLSPLELNFDKIGWLLLLMPISYLVNYLIGYSVGLFAFFSKDERDYSAVIRVFETLTTLLNGTFIPLDKIGFIPFVWLFPQAFFMHHPMQIYLGKYNLEQILFSILGGVLWIVILIFLSRILMRIGMKKNEAVGL